MSKTCDNCDTGHINGYTVVELCPKHAAVDDLLEACKEMLEMFDDGHCMSRFDWGKSFLRAEDIRELNEKPLRARSAIAKAEKP